MNTFQIICLSLNKGMLSESVWVARIERFLCLSSGYKRRAKWLFALTIKGYDIFYADTTVRILPYLQLVVIITPVSTCVYECASVLFLTVLLSVGDQSMGVLPPSASDDKQGSVNVTCCIFYILFSWYFHTNTFTNELQNLQFAK